MSQSLLTSLQIPCLRPLAQKALVPGKCNEDISELLSSALTHEVQRHSLGEGRVRSSG